MPLPANHSGITERQDFAPAFLRLFEFSGYCTVTARPDYRIVYGSLSYYGSGYCPFPATQLLPPLPYYLCTPVSATQ